MSGSVKKTGKGAGALDYYARKGYSEGQLKDLEVNLVKDLDEVFGRGGVWQDSSGRFREFFFDGDQVKHHSDPLQDELKQFARGFNPKTGEALVQNAGDNRQTGYDFTFSAPKSVSYIWAMADDATKARIEKAFLNAVREANNQLNIFAGETTCGAQGKDRVGCQYAFSSYLEFTGRPTDAKGNLIPEDPIHAALNKAHSGGEYGDGLLLDMQVHAHGVMPNMAATDRGDFLKVNGPHLMKWQGVWAEAGHAALAHEFQAMGFEITREEGKVAFEIAGIDQELRDGFSRRSQQIDENAKKYGLDSVADAATARGLEQAIKQKDKKSHVDVTEAQVQGHWDIRSEMYGMPRAEAQALIARAMARGPQEIKPVTIKEANELLEKILQSESIVTEPRFRAAMLGAFTGRGTVSEIHSTASDCIRQHAVAIGTKDRISVYSTQEMIDLEHRMLKMSIEHKHEKSFDEKHVEAAIKTTQAAKLKDNPLAHMSPQQKDAVRYICNGLEGVVVLEGRAGAGKSFTLDAVRAVYQSAGYKIEGLALSHKASQVLKHEGKLDNVAAIEGFCRKLKNGKIKLTNKSLVIIDEAGLVGSRHMEMIISNVKDSGAKLILAGDTRQIQSVASGGAMRVIVREKLIATGQGSFTLNEVRRQSQDWDKAAGLSISKLDTAVAISEYLKKGRSDYVATEVDGRLVDSGRFLIADKRSESIDALFKDYVKSTISNPDQSSILIAFKNDDVNILNEMAHDHLRDAGLLGPEVSVTVKAGKDETKPMALSEGDVIQFRDISKKIEINDIAQTEEGEVYNRTCAKIEKIDGEGDATTLTVRLYEGDKLSGKTVKVSGSDFKDGTLPVQRAFCLTTDTSQGGTWDNTFLMGGGLDNARAYVGCTRHRKNLTLAIDKDSLYAHASRNYDADNYINRNRFTDLMALDVLAHQWKHERVKETTVDYLNEAHRRMAAQEALQKATNKKPSVSEILQTLPAQCAGLVTKIKSMDKKKILDAVIKPSLIWAQDRVNHMSVKDHANREELKKTLSEAAKEYGSRLWITGKVAFHKACISVAKEVGIRFSNPATTRILKEMKNEFERTVGQLAGSSDGLAYSPGIQRPAPVHLIAARNRDSDRIRVREVPAGKLVRNRAANNGHHNITDLLLPGQALGEVQREPKGGDRPGEKVRSANDRANQMGSRPEKGADGIAKPLTQAPASLPTPSRPRPGSRGRSQGDGGQSQ